MAAHNLLSSAAKMGMDFEAASPMSPFDTASKRRALSGIQAQSIRKGSHKDLFKTTRTSSLGVKIVIPANEVPPVQLKRSNSTMCEDGEYGFGDLLSPTKSETQSRRNSLDEGLCDELMLSPTLKQPTPIMEEEVFDGFPVVQSAVLDVEYVRAKKMATQASAVHRVSEQARGELAGESHYTGTAKEIRRQMDAPRRATVNEQLRGETAGEKTYVGIDSTHISSEIAAQTVVADYRRVNEQNRTNGARGFIPPDSVDNVRTRAAQNVVASVRMVSEEARGELAGQQNNFSTDSKQLSGEMRAQADIASIARVSEQARGELAGQQTRFDYEARETQRHIGFQRQIAETQRINQQVIATSHIATIPSDAIENTRAARGQSMTFEGRKVNEQVRGELAGRSTGFGTTSANMYSITRSQKMANKQFRVNHQARGELAGQKTAMDASSVSVVAARDAPKTELVNQQVKHVGRGFLPTDMVEMKRIQKIRAAEEITKANAAAQKGKSQFGADSEEMSRVINNPKPAAINHQIRGETAGQQTSYGASSLGMSLAINAPKTRVHSQHVGNIARSGAEVSYADKAEEWMPDNHRITPDLKEEPNDTPMNKSDGESAEAVTWQMDEPDHLGLREGMKSMPKNFTLARRKRQADMASKGKSEEVKDFKTALARFR